MIKRRRYERHQQQRDEARFTWKERLVIVLTAAVVYKLAIVAAAWVEEARRPFCDGRQARDRCRPCPENGVCGDGEMRCAPGFRRQGSLSVSDKQIDRIAHYLAESVHGKVCRISGDSLCTIDATTWVPEHEVWDDSMEQKMGLDAHSSWLVHEKAAQLVRHKLNIRIDDFGLRDFECPIELAVAYQSIGCRIRKGIKANLYGIFFTVSTVVSVAVYILQNSEYKKIVNRSEDLYLQVCEVLEERADGKTKWIEASQLRIQLLFREEQKITTLWKKVEKLVQEDSQLDQYQKHVNGNPSLVWEWQA